MEKDRKSLLMRIDNAMMKFSARVERCVTSAGTAVLALVLRNERVRALVNAVTQWGANVTERSRQEWAHREALAAVRWAKVIYDLRD